MSEWNPDWASAIASIESAGSGNYGAVGPLTSKGNRAYGRYQVMDFNIPNWTRKYVGREMTPDEFLADPRAQDLVFQGEFGSYVQRYGNPQDAASTWFTGRPASQGAGASDMLGMTGSDYVNKFNAALGDQGVIARGIGNDTLVALGRASTTRTEAPMGLLNMGQQMPQQAGQPAGNGFWDNFAGGILADPDRRAKLAMAFEGMALNPNQSVIDIAKSSTTDRKTQATLNKTIEWLRGQPNGEAYIRMIEAGASPAQVIQAYQQAQAAQAAATSGEVREVDGRLVRVMPDGTVQEIYSPYANGGASPEQISQAGALRDDLSREIGDFGIVRSGYDNIMTFYNDPNGVSDYALAVAFAKILDPGSVARESEVAAVRSAGAQVPAFAQFFENALTGKGSFPPEVRQQIAQAASDIYSQKASNAQTIIDRYQAASEQFGIPWELVYMGSDIPSAQPIAPARPTVPASAAAAGVTQQQWDAMTTAEKAEFP